VKRLIATLSLALFAFPAAALGAPDSPPSSGSPLISRVPPQVLDHWAQDQPVRRALPAYPRAVLLAPAQARGTDVAAPDQQASADAPSPAPTSAASDFDWADAGIGAAVAAGTLALALAGAMTVRRSSRGASARPAA
jgi:hypothetical protein